MSTFAGNSAWLKKGDFTEQKANETNSICGKLRLENWPPFYAEWEGDIVHYLRDLY